MRIQTEFINIPVADKTMRTMIAAPAAPGVYPGIILYTDIYQLSDSVRRTIGRLAGYGFVVAAPEIFYRLEPAGTVIEQGEAGVQRGMGLQKSTPVTQFDEDCRALIAHLQQMHTVDAERLGATGFCIGGHLAFRAAFNPEIKASVCFYPSWLHSGLLGAEQQAGSLERAAEIRGEMLVIFGALDALIPPAGRTLIETTLQQAGVRHETRLYEAEHGFVREDRAAHDPECADAAFGEMVQWFRRVLP